MKIKDPVDIAVLLFFAIILIAIIVDALKHAWV